MSEVTLRYWTIAKFQNGIPYLLAKTVLNHPLIGTGNYGHSTPIIWLDLERGLCQTVNTLYWLESPSEDLQEPALQQLIAELHPKNVPPEIRRAHSKRLPYPGTAFEDDVVAHWNIHRWTGLQKGVDFLVDPKTPSNND